MLKFDFLKKRSFRFLFLAISGFLSGLTTCYTQLGILQWISIIPAALVAFSVADDEKNRLRSAYCYGLFFYMTYFIAVWHWFAVMYPLEFTGMDKMTALAVVVAAVLGLPLVQASTFAFVFVLFAKIKRGRVASRFPIITPIAFAVLWAIFEWTQTLFWFGVPWGRLALGQTGVLFTLQTASLFGSYFVTFIIVLVNALLAYALYRADLRRVCAVSCAAVFAVNAFTGVVLMSLRPAERETAKVAAVQGNISSTEKWAGNWWEITKERYGALTAEAAAEGAEIVIWPETVVRVPVENKDVFEWLSDLADDQNVTLLVGCFSDFGRRNSVVAFGPDGEMSEDIYSKRYLVPFGEFVPMRGIIVAILPWLTEIGMLSGDLTPGDSANVLDTEYGTIGSMICFDSIYEPTALDNAGSGAELIAIETNDSWFYDSAALWMHEGQAKMRAIEMGKYVVRAANTGVSAIISPKGEVLGELGPLKTGYVAGEVGFIPQNTMYVYIGNLFVWLAIGAIAGLLGADVTLRILENRKARNEDSTLQ